MKRNLFLFFRIILVVLATNLFLSCTKGQIDKEQAQGALNINDEFGKYTKELTIYDEAKENSAVLLVGSNDKTILDMWTSNNFTLLPVIEGESVHDVLANNFSQDSIPEEIFNNDYCKSDDDDDDDEIVAEISIQLLSKNLKDGVSHVLLHSQDPYDDNMKGWKYETHYCRYFEYPNALGRGIVTFYVYGYNFWHKGYWAMFKLDAEYSSNWFTLFPEWVPITSGGYVSESHTCYMLKGRRKYKGKNNHSVIITFSH